MLSFLVMLSPASYIYVDEIPTPTTTPDILGTSLGCFYNSAPELHFMRRLHVVVQSREDYDNERRADILLFLRLLWWCITSALSVWLITSVLKISPTITCILFAFFFGLQFWRNLIAQGSLKAYVGVMFGIIYAIYTLLIVYVALFRSGENSDFTAIGLVFAAIFAYLAYNEFNKNTDIFERS
jgi:hypothetical protein